MSPFASVEEQMHVLERGVVDLVTREDLAVRLERARSEGRPLRVKLGIDPSSPNLHVGHTVVARKLRAFQDLGHRAVLVWGTATAMLGDPSGQDRTRPQLTREEVERNLASYLEQVGRVVDVEAAEQRRNGEWFDSMGFPAFIRLCSRSTVARMLERDSFAQRLRAGSPIGVHELVYPLMQGWDSVELRCDVELGGTDQLFNLMVGRDLQREEGQQPQVCVTMPILEGLDGKRKMSKSYGNAIGVTEPPREVFGKLMRIPDTLMEKYFLLLTDLPPAEVAAVLAGHPRQAKARLAREVTAWLHGSEAADRAVEEFDRVFQGGGLYDEIPETAFPPARLREGRAPVAAALVEAGIASSGAQARALIQGGGVRVDGVAVRDGSLLLDPGRHLLQAGKRKAAWLVVP